MESYRVKSDAEEVLIVDDKNRRAGVAKRAEMRRLGLIHRATYVMVFNAGGNIFIAKRAADKDFYPGAYDLCAGGVVRPGESYLQSARRELAEELGIARAPLKRLFDFYGEYGGSRIWGRAYVCRYDGPLVLQKEEISSGAWYDSRKAVSFCGENNCTPDSLYVFERYLAEQNADTARNERSGRN